MHPHTAIEVSVCRLLGRQLDRAADRAATGLFRTAVCGFHDAGATASHDREPEPRNGRAHSSRQLVMRIIVLDAGRAKDRHTRTDEVKGTKSAQEIAHHAQESDELFETRARSFKEDFIRAFCGRGQS